MIKFPSKFPKYSPMPSEIFRRKDIAPVGNRRSSSKSGTGFTPTTRMPNPFRFPLRNACISRSCRGYRKDGSISAIRASDGSPCKSGIPSLPPGNRNAPADPPPPHPSQTCHPDRFRRRAAAGGGGASQARCRLLHQA